ncbi:hypothetical protein D3C86_1260680 [compost metagenome]
MYASLTRIIRALMAVLKRRPSMSEPTFLMVLCSARLSSMASVAGTSLMAGLRPSSATTRRYRRARKRKEPSTFWVFQGLAASSGPMNIS